VTRAKDNSLREEGGGGRGKGGRGEGEKGRRGGGGSNSKRDVFIIHVGRDKVCTLVFVFT
jgi:hypothetical protein